MRACLYQVFDPEQELKKLGCDSTGIALMAPKMRFHTLKLHGLPLQAALILKQEALSRGAEAALPRDAVALKMEHVDLLLMGTDRQLEKLGSKLKLQPPALADIGENIIDLVRRARHRLKDELQLGTYRLPLGKRTLIMGILNLTPDSFSDGGSYSGPEKALERARQMVAEGADIIDLGGESTRPGSQRISSAEELGRIMPILKALKDDSRFNAPLSIDTYKAKVAREALEAGVEMINDVWGLKKDATMGALAAQYGVPVCLMHNRTSTDYSDLVPEILSELEESITIARNAGIDESNIMIDPGIGFGKDLQQNLAVMQRLRDFQGLGYPLLLGTSRKSLIGKTLDLPVDDRLEGTAATVAFGITAGADIIRVHDVREMQRVVQMTDAIVRR